MERNQPKNYSIACLPQHSDEVYFSVETIRCLDEHNERNKCALINNWFLMFERLNKPK